MGLLLYASLVLLFASWATTHVLLCLRLATLSWKEALVGLVFFPMAGYYGQERRLSKLTTVWVVTLAAYLVTLIVGAVYGDVRLARSAETPLGTPLCAVSVLSRSGAAT